MRIVSLFAVMFLAGCSIFSTSSRSYDPVEYGIINEAIVDTTRAIHFCKDQNNVKFTGHVADINANTLRFDEFLRNKNDSKALVDTNDNIRQMVNQVLIRGRFSLEYCQFKLGNIQASTRIIARTLGGTDQHGMCDGGVTDRLTAFTASFSANKITTSEYKELAQDIVRLKAVDVSGCDQTNKQKYLKGMELLEKILPGILSL